MSRQYITLDDRLYQYLLDNSLRETDILARLRGETAGLPMANMQIAPEQGQFMAWLVKVTGARRCIEVGVFTGYSALAVALALPDDGYLLACDVNADWTGIARRYWAEAGVAERIDLRLAPAADTLAAGVAGGEAGSYDFAFIDADKENYAVYFDHVIELLRPGGVVLVDNVLWSGSVADPGKNDTDTAAIRAFNEKLLADPRVDISMIPLADGLTLARKI